MITVKHKGNFNNIERFFNRALKRDYLNIISDYAERGVKALKEATPVVSGETAAAWDYEIESGNGITTLWFTNSEEDNGVNVAILLIYGHGTRNGGYVEGIDFVSPALRPVFEDLANAMWKEVTE
jgi:hypothetical protein